MPRLDPVEKLPLAVRKDIRDNWENRKEELEGKISTLLGAPWTVTIDPKAIYPYGEEGSYAKNSTGDMIRQYVESVEYQLNYFISSYGEEGKKEINSTATAHNITMEFDEAKKYTYCGVEVSPAGDLVILFTEGNLGTNINDAFEKSKLQQALNDAPTNAASGKPLSYYARASVGEEYTPKIQEVQDNLNKILGKEIALDGAFDEAFAKLKGASNAPSDWEKNFGYFIRLYFEALNDYLKYEKFDSDDMLQEGLTEAIESNAVRFRIVDKLEKSSYNEPVIEDGVLYLQTTPDNFGCNTSQIANKLIDLL